MLSMQFVFGPMKSEKMQSSRRALRALDDCRVGSLGLLF
jgi:hypothetical protein